MATPITFLVPGQSQVAGAMRGGESGRSSEVPGRVKQSVRVAPAARAGADEVTVEAVPGEDVVVLTIAGGPKLTLHPENARDLLRAQTSITRSGTPADDRGAVQVPAQLQWRGLEPSGSVRGATRGFLGDVVLSAVDVVTGLFKDEDENPLTGFVGNKVIQKVDAQVDPGVYVLNQSSLPPLKENGRRVDAIPAASDGAPHLVLIHGTFSNTSAAFGRLWSDHPDRVRRLFKYYSDRVYALDHQTLGVSPITNALELARTAPANARLHLLTHSRGGLVAEVLARVCGSPGTDPAMFAGADFEEHRNALEELSAVVSAKSLRVERIVRVACPARGTLLASKRLDAYLSVFKWTLELAGVPVLPALVEFLGSVARLRADETKMPGLAAQVPDSPLIQWLHDGTAQIPGDLRVIAGDVQGDSIKSWLKTLLADSFYWTDNDLVVQTRSMYGGSPRASKAQFLLHQAGDVSHGLYFKNERTAEATVTALTQDAPADFRTIGPLSWAGESSTGVRAARRSSTAGTTNASKPAVFLLPGILGSNLKEADGRVWLAWRVINGLDRLKYEPGRADKVLPDGPIGLFYDALADFLSSSHEVIEFGFDWRRPIEEEARRLGEAVDRALESRVKSGTPVRIVAHSMGGIVARTFALERRDIWERMLKNPGGRLLMLGTPNGGSYAPMQVLSGDDTLGNVVSAIGAPFREGESRQVIAAFPGLLQLQADLLDEAKALGTEEKWRQLADTDIARVKANSWWHRLPIQIRSLEWGVPSQATLNSAAALRRRLDQQRDRDLPAFKSQVLLVVGQAALTPVGFDDQGPDGVVYLNEVDLGDGRVSRESAMLPGVTTWKVDVDHGNLPSHRTAFPAYLELLEHGTTSLLEAVPQIATRGAAAPAALVRTRPSRVTTAAQPPQDEGDVVTGGRPDDEVRVDREPLRVTVTNGDLSFTREPLLLGHYRSSKLTGTENVMNRLIGGAMKSALEVGLYPDPPGSHQIFVNTNRPADSLRSPRPEAVIVAGLGEEGSLRGSDLVTTVRQAVIAWVQRIAEQPRAAASLDIAATLIGSGGSGISAGQSAQMIAAGVHEANDRIARLHDTWPLVSHLHLIELYLDRAAEACRALLMQADANPSRYQVTEVVHQGQGWLTRPIDSGYRGADYDFLTAVSTRDVDDEPAIGYTIDTKRARTEIRSQSAQGNLLKAFVAAASNDATRDDQLRSALFQLLIPIEMEPFLEGSTEMQIELDRETAGIPWELLDPGPKPGEPASAPWAIRCKLVRKLRTDQFREHVVDASPEARVLVIGEPECDAKKYPPLPGARAEARAVVERLVRPGALASNLVTSLVPADGAAGANSQTIVKTVMNGPWRVVHIAGHGEPPLFDPPEPTKPGDPAPKLKDPRGVVLSNDTFLGPREIRNMRTVPELVFVNCCHLAVKPGQLLGTGDSARTFNRAKFASGVAEELIRIGVRCVIAAGWAVEDGPAETFASTFYDALLRDCRFIDAVAQARAASHRLGGNTWGAYQCYGDPDWMLRRSGGDAQRPARSLVDEFASIMSARGLTLALETLAVRSKFQNADKVEQRTKLQHLEARFSQWANFGAVAEAFGMAWLAAGDRSTAIAWLERAIAANDGGASLKAVQELANMRTRETVSALTSARDGSSARSLIDDARKSVEKDIALLTNLTNVQSTSERETLLGAAFKRLALLERLAGRTAAEAAANALVHKHYALGEKSAIDAKLSNAYYPAMNRMGAELVCKAGVDGTCLDGTAVAMVRGSLQKLVLEEPEFWNVAGLTELGMLLAIDAGTLAAELGRIEEEFSDLQGRLNATWMWRSVYDQADYVLTAYRRRATPPEQAAVDRLLNKLAGWADVTPKPADKKEDASGNTETTPKRAPASRVSKPRKRRR